jgi:hypothetical protein
MKEDISHILRKGARTMRLSNVIVQDFKVWVLAPYTLVLTSLVCVRKPQGQTTPPCKYLAGGATHSICEVWFVVEEEEEELIIDHLRGFPSNLEKYKVMQIISCKKIKIRRIAFNSNSMNWNYYEFWSQEWA